LIGHKVLLLLFQFVWYTLAEKLPFYYMNSAIVSRLNLLASYFVDHFQINIYGEYFVREPIGKTLYNGLTILFQTFLILEKS